MRLRLGTRNRRLVILALAAGMVAPLGACGGSTDSAGSAGAGAAKVNIRLVWWGNDDRAKATQAAVDLFQKKNPNITVKTEFAAYPAYFQKLSTQLAGGAAPDVIQLDRPNFGDFAKRGVIKDLTPYDGKALRTADINPKLLAAGKLGGKLFAVPGGQLTQMLAYDPTAWKAAGVATPTNGWTWDQFSADMKKLGAAGTPGTTDFGWAIDWFEVWLLQHGKQTYTTDGKLGFDAGDLSQFWSMLGDLRAAKGVSAPAATTKMDGSIPNSAFINKAADSEINYDSSLTAYISAKPGTQAVSLPTFEGKSGMGSQPTVTWAVTQRSTKADAAVKLVDFLVNDPEAGAILGATRGLPSNQTVRVQVAAKATGADKQVFDYEKSVADLATAQPPVWPVGSAEIKRNFQSVYDDVIFGKTSVQDGAKRVISDAQQSLNG